MTNNPDPVAENIIAAMRYDPISGNVYSRIDRYMSKMDAVIDYPRVDGYRGITFMHKKYLTHRVAFLLMTGAWPTDLLDHINGKRDDNRWENLREASNQENNWNAGPNKKNTSGVRGVHWCKSQRRWRATIRHEGKGLNLGSFETLAEATVARHKAEEQFRGQFSATKGVLRYG